MGQKLPLPRAEVKSFAVTLSVINASLLQFFAVRFEREKGKLGLLGEGG